MKVLISAKYVSDDAKCGGSGRFMQCVSDTLIELGHTVTTNVNDECDLIICSHDISLLKSRLEKKVFISHGVILEEACPKGADRYISISEEVRAVHTANGFNTDTIGQPIVIKKRVQPGFFLRNILIIRREEQLLKDPFDFLFDQYNVKVSDPNIPIEDQIAWADLCITLGRGALESMAQGKPVLIADNRHYMGAVGDGYVTPSNIKEIAKNNFSGRRFAIPITKNWVLAELKKYKAEDSHFLYNYVKKNHNAKTIVQEYLKKKVHIKPDNKVAFGCMVNDRKRLDLILRNSSLGSSPCFTIMEPETASKGLNTMLDAIEKSGAEIGVLTHQDMFYPGHWLPAMEKQIEKLPEDWVIAGIVGKDEEGNLCGRFHDMSSPLWIVSDHDLPVKCACLDECTIIVNMKSGFRFDEEMLGFDLYGTYACLRGQELGSVWIIDAWAEHYCTRFHMEWEPDEVFMKMWKWLYDRFPGQNLDSTVLVNKENQKQLDKRQELKLKAAS